MAHPATTILVIGASAGGVEAIRTVVAGLPGDLDAAVFVTLHIGAHKSDLPWLLSRAGAMSASHPGDGDAIRPGHIYVAPPDHHMLVEAGRVTLTKGPRENWARPAIDPMFRSAARAYGPDVVGVILTGGLNDGTAGLFQVKAHGGTTVVQDPSDAINATMPLSAQSHVEIDHVAPAGALGALLTRLVAERGADRLKKESREMSSPPDQQGRTAEFTQNRPLAVTCPDCGGALRQSELGTLSQFRCHIGHVYTAEVMLAAQFLALERFVEQALRSLSERAELCRQMSEKPPRADNPTERERWVAAMEEALTQSEGLHALITREWLHPSDNGLMEAPNS